MASTNIDKSRIDLAGVETGAKMFVMCMTAPFQAARRGPVGLRENVRLADVLGPRFS
jgi:hypothetical protein